MVYDVVIENGRVIDPESGLDELRNIGINDDKIVILANSKIQGKKVIDASGFVVAPGFIDIHIHGTGTTSNWMQAFDGVTTALELEAGAWPVGQAYEKMANDGRPLNYGFSSGWAVARRKVLGEDFRKIVSAEASKSVLDAVEQGIQEGGIGIGLLTGYLNESNREEYFGAAKLAAQYDVFTITHVRSKALDEPDSVIEGVLEVIAAAAGTGAHMHIAHINSSATKRIADVEQIILQAQNQGVRVTTEAYPWGAGCTMINAPFIQPDFLPRVGLTSDSIVYLKTGERPATNERLAEIQAQDPNGRCVIHYMDENKPDQLIHLDRAVLIPNAIIASDAQPYTIDGVEIEDGVWPIPEGAMSHPRSAGTFTRILGRYVRERNLMSLMEAIRRATLLPAQLLENTAPQMRYKGRLKAGADADVVIFDPDTVIERATYDNPRQPSQGVEYLMVNGQCVIAEGELNRDIRPGRPIYGKYRP